jgi:hypothetical protein
MPAGQSQTSFLILNADDSGCGLLQSNSLGPVQPVAIPT